MSGRRASAKCCADALKAALRHTDTPTPIRNRPIISPASPWDAPNTQMPAAAKTSMLAVTRRGPK